MYLQMKTKQNSCSSISMIFPDISDESGIVFHSSRFLADVNPHGNIPQYNGVPCRSEAALLVYCVLYIIYMKA